MSKEEKAIMKSQREIVRSQQREILKRLKGQSLSIVSSFLEGRVEEVVLCLDISGSMAGRKIDALKKAVSEFILTKKRIDIRDRTAMVVFDSPARKLFGLTNDHDLIKKEVSKLEIGWMTAMGQALSLSREILAGSRKLDVQLRIILLSDGYANGPGDPPKSLEEAFLLKELKVIVDTIGVSDGGRDFDEDLLKEIARITGGKYLRVEDISKLPRGVVLLAEKKLMLPSGNRLSLEEKKA